MSAMCSDTCDGRPGRNRRPAPSVSESSSGRSPPRARWYTRRRARYIAVGPRGERRGEGKRTRKGGG